MKGDVYVLIGDHPQVLYHHLKVYDPACEEGFLPCMIDASVHTANCCSTMHVEGVILMYYKHCEHLCHNSKNEQMWAHVWYNIGSIYQRWDDSQKTLPLLLRAHQILDDTSLCCHKLTLLYEQLNQKGGGLRYVQEMERQLDSHGADGRREIVQLIGYHYGTTVDAEAYINYLYILCDTSCYFHGFCQFHLFYPIAALKRKCRYKEAMRLMEETKFS